MNHIDVDRILSLLDRPISLSHAEVTGSTSDDLKAAALQGAADYSVRIADRQTKGRGREGKTFHSPDGLYLSLLLPYSPQIAPLLTHLAAVAVAVAIRETAKEDARIKWVNDVYARGKKVCGILTESIVAAGRRRVIVGIGVNANTPLSDFPDDLKEIAASISANKEVLAARILSEFFSRFDDFSPERIKEEYKELCFLVGEKVIVHKKEGGKAAVVLGLSDDLGLDVLYEEGTRETLISGEVSLRLRQSKE